jgi:hypothetical protein
MLTDLKIAGIRVKLICCDEARENRSMEEDLNVKGFGVKFEFSGPRTPQRNDKVERKFQIFYRRTRSMLNISEVLKDELRKKFG